ncbi:putative secoisolariciresinol dehydrogenase [Helianthus annuus]|nr:putative secoisolariciresinol dehydrogenase [Helianthus annuus]
MATTLKRLDGKVALITGAASGLGECTAKLFAEHGAKVILTDIQDDLGHMVSEAIGSTNSMFVHCDVSKEEDVKNAIDTAISTYGKLDIVFNNAGISDPLKPSIIDNEKTVFDRVIGVNVSGVFLGMKHAARVMVPARSGTIISTASTVTNVGGLSTHAYTASKHSIVSLTQNLAVELGQYGIRVNCVSPFGLFAPMTTKFSNMDQKTFENVSESLGNLKGVTLTPDDVANVALFLASNDACISFSLTNIHTCMSICKIRQIYVVFIFGLHFL